VPHPRRCHPERRAAKSKDLRFVPLRLGWDATQAIAECAIIF
jgi:hypothetical protein